MPDRLGRRQSPDSQLTPSLVLVLQVGNERNGPWATWVIEYLGRGTLLVNDPLEHEADLLGHSSSELQLVRGQYQGHSLDSQLADHLEYLAC